MRYESNFPQQQQWYDWLVRRTDHRRFACIWLIVVGGWLATCTHAIAWDADRDRWRACGLQLMWRGQSAADGLLATVQHVVPHVSSTRAREIFEVVSGEQRTAFVPEDLDRFGQPLGIEGAARQADIQQRTLVAQGQPATIDNRQVPETTLYLQTSLGVLQAIQGETGRLRWSVALGSDRLPSIPPSVDDQHLLASYGITLTLLDPVDGRLLWQRSMDNIPGNTLAVLNDRAWLPRWRGSLDVFTLSAPRQFPNLIMSIGRVTSPLSVSPAAITWATDAGYLYVLDPEEGRVRFRVKIRDLVSAPLAQDDSGNLYAATEGGVVLSVDSQAGKVRWQNLVDGEVYRPLLLLDDAVCLVTTTGWLVCLDATSGELRWRRNGIRSWIARGDQRVLAVDSQYNLVALGASDGQVHGVSPLGELRPLLSQAMTDRVYLTNGNGQITALRPVKQPWTNIFVPLRKQEEEATEAAEQPVTEEQVEPSQPAPPPAPEVPMDPVETDDPFADFDDPFG